MAWQDEVDMLLKTLGGTPGVFPGSPGYKPGAMGSMPAMGLGGSMRPVMTPGNQGAMGAMPGMLDTPPMSPMGMGMPQSTMDWEALRNTPLFAPGSSGPASNMALPQGYIARPNIGDGGQDMGMDWDRKARMIENDPWAAAAGSAGSAAGMGASPVQTLSAALGGAAGARRRRNVAGVRLNPDDYRKSGTGPSMVMNQPPEMPSLWSLIKGYFGS